MSKRISDDWLIEKEGNNIEFLGTLCLILTITTLAGITCRRVRVPAVIGQLLVGIVLGPAILSIVYQDVLMHDFSEVGVTVLMFIVRMERELELLKRHVKPNVMIAISGIALPVGFAISVDQLFAFSWKEVFFLELVLATTSVSISVEVLRELNVSGSKGGATTLRASAADDIVVVIILSTAVGMIGASTGDNAEVSFTVKLIGQGLFLIGIFLLIRSIAPYLLRLNQKMNVGSSVIIMSLIICLGMVYLADLVGLSSAVGAFSAGIAVGQTDTKTEIDFNTEAVGYAVFAPVFFTSTGLSVALDTLGEDLPLILAMTIMTILAKLLGNAWGTKTVGLSDTNSLMVGTGMVSRGGVILIIAQTGYQSRLLLEAYHTSMIVVIILTTLATPFLSKYLVKKQESALQ